MTSAGGGGGGGGGRRAPSLRLVNGRATTGVSLHTSSTESVRSPHHHLGQQQGGNNNNNNNNHNNNNNNNNCHAGNNPAANNHPRLNKDDSIKISIENTNTCTDSLVTALDDETLLITDFVADQGQFLFHQFPIVSSPPPPFLFLFLFVLFFVELICLGSAKLSLKTIFYVTQRRVVF